MGDERRFDTRFPLRLAVTVTSSKTSRDLFSEDVSFRGLFVRTDEPYPLRSLVRVHLVTPADGRGLELLAMAVHFVPFDNEAGHPPGSGLQLYALDRDTRARWDAVVAFARAHPDAGDVVPDGAPEPEPVCSSAPRHQAELAVHVERPEGPVLFSRDLRQGGLLLGTDLDLPVGASLLLHVAHPRTGELVDLEAVVRHRVREPEGSALGVELVRLDERRRRLLAEIVEPWVPVFDDPDVLSSKR
jgi:hypothetical protein